MTTDALDVELEELLAEPVHCRRCGTAFPSHNGGGPVTVVAGGWSSPAAAVPVTCPGFLWIDASGPSPTYGT